MGVSPGVCVYHFKWIETVSCAGCAYEPTTVGYSLQHQVSQHKFDADVPGRPDQHVAGVDLSETLGMHLSAICHWFSSQTRISIVRAFWLWAHLTSLQAHCTC
jgi:hypothetical protein